MFHKDEPFYWRQNRENSVCTSTPTSFLVAVSCEHFCRKIHNGQNCHYINTLPTGFFYALILPTESQAFTAISSPRQQEIIMNFCHKTSKRHKKTVPRRHHCDTEPEKQKSKMYLAKNQNPSNRIILRLLS